MSGKTQDGIVSHIINGVIRKFEEFGKFYIFKQDDKEPMQMKGRIKSNIMFEFTYLRTITDYIDSEWGIKDQPYDNFFWNYLKDSVSENGEGRGEMVKVLKDNSIDEDEKPKTKWEKMMG